MHCKEILTITRWANLYLDKYSGRIQQGVRVIQIIKQYSDWKWHCACPSVCLSTVFICLWWVPFLLRLNNRWIISQPKTAIRYQEELPSLILSRPDKHITHSELVKLMEWKLTVSICKSPPTSSLLDTRTATDPQCVLVWPLCWCTEREVQAEAAAAGGLQQCGHCGEMLQEGIQPPAWCKGSNCRTQLPERSWPSHRIRWAQHSYVSKWIKAQYLLGAAALQLNGFRSLHGCIYTFPGANCPFLFQLCWQQELQTRLHSCLMKPWRAYRD